MKDCGFVREISCQLFKMVHVVRDHRRGIAQNINFFALGVEALGVKLLIGQIAKKVKGHDPSGFKYFPLVIRIFFVVMVFDNPLIHIDGNHFVAGFLNRLSHSAEMNFLDVGEVSKYFPRCEPIGF